MRYEIFGLRLEPDEGRRRLPFRTASTFSRASMPTAASLQRANRFGQRGSLIDCDNRVLSGLTAKLPLDALPKK